MLRPRELHELERVLFPLNRFTATHRTCNFDITPGNPAAIPRNSRNRARTCKDCTLRRMRQVLPNITQTYILYISRICALALSHTYVGCIILHISLITAPFAFCVTRSRLEIKLYGSSALKRQRNSRLLSLKILDSTNYRAVKRDQSEGTQIELNELSFRVVYGELIAPILSAEFSCSFNIFFCAKYAQNLVQ